MLRIDNIKLQPGADAAALAAEAARQLKTKEKDITQLRILRRSIDARDGVQMVYTVEVNLSIFRSCIFTTMKIWSSPWKMSPT